MKKSNTVGCCVVICVLVCLYFLSFDVCVAAELRSDCPETEWDVGYIQVEKGRVSLYEDECPDGYIDVGVVSASCSVGEPMGYCYMYAPAGVSYTDESGLFEYTEFCEMESTSSSSSSS